MNKLSKEQIENLKKIGCNVDENNYSAEYIMKWGLDILSSSRPDEHHRCYVTTEPQDENRFSLTVHAFQKLDNDNISKQGQVIFNQTNESKMQCLYAFAIWCDEIKKG